MVGPLGPAGGAVETGEGSGRSELRFELDVASVFVPWIALRRSGCTVATSGDSVTGVGGVDVEAGGGLENGAELRGGPLFDDGPVGACLSVTEGDGVAICDVGDVKVVVGSCGALTLRVLFRVDGP